MDRAYRWAMRRWVPLIVVLSVVVAIGTVLAVTRDRNDGSGQTHGPLPSVSPAPPRALTVAAAGDICLSSPESCAPTAALIRSLTPDAVLTLGDNQYTEGALAQYLASYDHAWGTFKDITYPVAGNHEWRTPGAEGFKDYFSRDDVWYTFTLAGWRFYALDGTCEADGGCAEGDPQYAWLDSQLGAHTDRCILAYWHQPRFSSGTEHGSDEAVGPLWDLLSEAGVDLILNGHEHNYERFAPQDPSGSAAVGGPVEIVAGTGGAGGYPFGAPIANSRVRLNGPGVLELRLWGDGWVERFLRPDGTVADQATGSC